MIKKRVHWPKVKNVCVKSKDSMSPFLGHQCWYFFNDKTPFLGAKVKLTLYMCFFFKQKQKPWRNVSLICWVLFVLCVLVAQLCLPLCDPMDYSLPGSSVHGILQAWILEWVAILFSRDLPGLGIESGSPGLQAESLLPEPPGMPSLF